MGSVIPTRAIGALPVAEWTAFRIKNQAVNAQAEKHAEQASGKWRPPQWQNTKQLTMLTAPAIGSSPATSYFFDAVLHIDHQQMVRMTEHPVQTGANLVDHAYMQPARVTLEIGMSDAMDRVVAGQYTSDASKSISAFRKLKELQKARVPLTVTTRLDTYANMLIESIDAPDDYRTSKGLKARVVFRQIFTATVSTATTAAKEIPDPTAESARPQQTKQTTSGPKQSAQPDKTLSNNKITSKPLGSPTVPGSGTFSCNSGKGQFVWNAATRSGSCQPIGK